MNPTPTSRATRRLAAALAALAVLAPAAAAPEAEARKVQRAAALCRKGARFASDGDRARASAEFEKALAVVPVFPDAHLGLGHVAMAEGHHQAALDAYQRAREGYTALGDTLHELREERYRETRQQMSTIRDQISSLGRARSNARTDPRGEADIQRRLTVLQDHLNKLEAVEPPQRDAEPRVPAEVWFYIGNAQFRLERFDEARASWETCAELNPTFAMIHNNLAVLHWKAGRFDRAREELDTAERLGFAVHPKMKEDLAAAAAGATR